MRYITSSMRKPPISFKFFNILLFFLNQNLRLTNNCPIEVNESSLEFNGN